MEWSPIIEAFFPHLISKASNKNVPFALNRAMCFNLHKLFLPSKNWMPKTQSNSVFQKFSEPPPLNRTLNPEQRQNTKHSQNCRRNDPSLPNVKSWELCKRTHSKVVSRNSFACIEHLPTKWGRLRNFSGLDWFVGARRMEELLNFFTWKLGGAMCLRRSSWIFISLPGGGLSRVHRPMVRFSDRRQEARVPGHI